MPKYAPGSFSKNFAWHGTGLRRLHNSIRKGFNAALQAVDRDQWRRNSGIGEAGLQLIPANFFLYNHRGHIAVDELVYQAVNHSHSIRFDRLALYAFHLNRVGTPPYRGPARPAMWANEFVRQQLWQNGSWRTASLRDSPLDAFISNTMKATKGVRVKARTNYRHLYELCGYWPTKLPEINSGSEDWAEQALLLSWDRLVLEQGPQTEAQLVAWVDQEELYKLMGENRAPIRALALSLAKSYLAAGALGRFTVSSAPAISAAPPQPRRNVRTQRRPSAPRAASAPAVITAELLNESGSNNAVRRRLVKTYAQKRDQRLASHVRLFYGHECMVCGLKLQIGDQLFYAEAAHIKPLGKPHSGPDKAGNLLVLCPNHHLQFDSGVIRIQRDRQGQLVIHSKINGDPLNGRILAPRHALDETLIQWHFEWFGEKIR